VKKFKELKISHSQGGSESHTHNESDLQIMIK